MPGPVELIVIVVILVVSCLPVLAGLMALGFVFWLVLGKFRTDAEHSMRLDEES